MKTKNIIITGMLTSLICIFSVITLPINTIPITLSTFSVFFISIISDLKKSVSAVMIYILCGCLGLPVFSGFRGGINVLLGPTGGYITGYLFIALIVGLSSEKTRNSANAKRFFYLILSSLFSLMLCYVIGMIQFSVISNISLKQSAFLCIYPFVLFDIIKIIIAILLAETIRKHLKHIDI